MGVAQETVNDTNGGAGPHKPGRRLSPRALALLVTLAILVTLGVGALADTLAVAPLRPPTQGLASHQAGLYTVALSIAPEPLTAGADSTFTLRVTDTMRASLVGARVLCDYTMPTMPMPTMLVTGVEDAPGEYTCRETLTDPGGWALTVTITPPAAGAVHTSFTLQAR